MKIIVIGLLFLLGINCSYAQKSPNTLEETLEWLKEKVDTFGYVPENYCDLFACSVYGLPKENVEFLGSHSNKVLMEYDVKNTLIFLKLHFEMTYLQEGCDPPCNWQKDTIDVMYTVNIGDINNVEKKDIKHLLPSGCVQNYNRYPGYVIYAKSNVVKRIITSKSKGINKETRSKLIYGIDIFNPDFDITKSIIRAINYAKFLCPDKETSKF